MSRKSEIYDVNGDVLHEVEPVMNSFFRIGGHYYHCTPDFILHINDEKDLINKNTIAYISDREQIEYVTKGDFEAALREAIFNIGIYQFVK
jgi:hypothetical protein